MQSKAFNASAWKVVESVIRFRFCESLSKISIPDQDFDMEMSDSNSSRAKNANIYLIHSTFGFFNKLGVKISEAPENIFKEATLAVVLFFLYWKSQIISTFHKVTFAKSDLNKSKSNFGPFFLEFMSWSSILLVLGVLFIFLVRVLCVNKHFIKLSRQ